MKQFLKWLESVLPDMLTKQIQKVTGAVPGYEVKAYWCGSVLRIDIKPMEDK